MQSRRTYTYTDYMPTQAALSLTHCMLRPPTPLLQSYIMAIVQVTLCPLITTLIGDQALCCRQGFTNPDLINTVPQNPMHAAAPGQLPSWLTAKGQKQQLLHNATAAERGSTTAKEGCLKSRLRAEPRPTHTSLTVDAAAKQVLLLQQGRCLHPSHSHRADSCSSSCVRTA